MSPVTSWERIWYADGKIEGKLVVLMSFLSRRPELRSKYGSMVASATSESDVDRLETRIISELCYR